MIIHKTKTDWGFYYQCMDEKGRSFGRAYIYNDRKNTIYLDSLSVRPKFRRNGYGRIMQMRRELLGFDLGCKYACLWVKKKSWMRKWYKRRGYKFHEDKKDDPKSVWLRKKL